jgi:transcriptional regulator with XRE-family HTH domain
MTSLSITYKLRNWRRQQGLSQAEAAEKMSVARRTWHQWERGTVVPGPEHMVKLVHLTQSAIEPNDFYALPAQSAA